MDKEVGEIALGNAPSQLVEMAISKGADLDKLEKLLALQERWEANQARKVFATAFAAAQSKIITVAKTKINPQTHSNYAALEDIIESAQPIYTQEGFAVIFYEGDIAVPGFVRIFADILHAAGHRETFHLDMPLDGVGLKGTVNMTAIHGKGSAIKYAQRYLLCMIWNIPTKGDNDGNTLNIVEYIDEKQVAEIESLVASKNVEIKKFCEAFKIEEISKLTKNKYQQAISILNAKKVAK